MQPIRSLLFIFLALSLYIGCTDVGFNTIKSSTCADFNVDDGFCEQGEGVNHYTASFRAGQLDVLFVVDNSGSMYVEQNEMANRLSNLLDKINIEDFDYQLAVTTTDVTVNGGQFLTFPDGKTILNRNSSNVLSQLQNTIKRDETLVCDQNSYQEEFCPSGDERGVYAVNMAIDRAENTSFFRQNAHLAIVILSDEDERSFGGRNSNYPLEDYDLPETLIDKVNAQLGVTKTFSVHAVIVRPGDNTCFSNQTFLIPGTTSKRVIGQYGEVYAELAQPDDELRAMGHIVDGVLGNICASNYGSQMGDIGSNVSDAIDSYQLPCSPEEGSIVISHNGPASLNLGYTKDQNNLLTFQPAIPPATEVTLNWTCPNYL